jgi:hypothetical protein
MVMANLLVSDCENPLSVLILLGEGFELLDRFGLGNREKELDVLARIFMSTLVKMISCKYLPMQCVLKYLAHIDFGVIWEGRKCLVQGFVHLSRATLEESSTSYMYRWIFSQSHSRVSD